MKTVSQAFDSKHARVKFHPTVILSDTLVAQQPCPPFLSGSFSAQNRLGSIAGLAGRWQDDRQCRIANGGEASD